MKNPSQELQDAREYFAEELRSAADLRSAAVVRAFAEVHREEFLGPGPWEIWHPYRGDYSTTADADPKHLCHNVIVAIDRTRKLNNGMPSALAYMIEALELKGGEHVVHLGCGVGYYTAILACVVGDEGRVTAVEADPGLAARASANLASWKWVSANAADGCSFEFDEADAILVNAGATHPMDHWLKKLAPGGRMVLPLTGKNGGGVVMKVKRLEQNFSATFLLPIAIYPFIGARDTAEEETLDRALRSGRLQLVRSLRIDTHETEDSCWMHTERFCLSFREAAK
jgi:protein-L-isoaspartate(D-aspartate) O-methyltransferase